jgi:hypothetical protein
MNYDFGGTPSFEMLTAYHVALTNWSIAATFVVDLNFICFFFLSVVILCKISFVFFHNAIGSLIRL